MHTKELLRANLEMTLGFVVSMIEEMKDAPLTFPTPKGGNHPLWVLGHSTYAESGIIHEKMLGEAHPIPEWKDVFGDGTEPVDDADKYPPFYEVMAKCQEVRQGTMSLLDSLCEEDLDAQSKGCDPKFAQFFGTYRLCFLFVANHWMMHRGQVADARRAAGRTNYGT